MTSGFFSESVFAKAHSIRSSNAAAVCQNNKTHIDALFQPSFPVPYSSSRERHTRWAAHLGEQLLEEQLNEQWGYTEITNQRGCSAEVQ